MAPPTQVDALFARFVEHHVRHGERLSAEELCEGRDDLLEPLRRRIESYLRLDGALDRGPGTGPPPPPRDADAPLPSFEGFQTIERIGSGGMGEVYKLRDLKLDRIVAGKVVRPDARLRASLADFLREAQAMALFQDDRIVQVFEFRADADPPALIMEKVEGFELGRVGPSLEYHQRARVLLDVCEALERAHALGIQHRDLKPANIMLTAGLKPKILDFGLSGREPTAGHLRGTPHYLAPEQLDPSQPIDARTDVYALGVILYELLSGTVPYAGDTVEKLVAGIEDGPPRLPVELDPTVPEPLQAIALKAMEADPDLRYRSAGEMARDLRRYVDGRPVQARPTQYASALGKRVRPHLEAVEEWQRLKLIYPHEAGALRSAYRRLEAREDDWIVESRVLSWSQIALYLGAFLLVAGSLLYFSAHRFFPGAVTGLAGPLLVLGLPFIGLTLAGQLLYRKEHRAVAVAFYLASVLLLPLLLLIAFHEAGLWVVEPGEIGQFFYEEGAVSNRQLQVAIGIAVGWAVWLAWRTRTLALSTVAMGLGFFFTLALLSDLGLRDWWDAGRYDLMAINLVPLLVVQAYLGHRLEREGLPWFSRPLYIGSAGLLVAVLQLLALDGKAFRYLGLTMSAYQGSGVADPVLLDTVTALSLNGILFYLVASLLDRHGSELMKGAAWLLVVVSPFATLEPMAYLNTTGEYSASFLWLFLMLSLAIVLLSHYRQRKTFYLAGLLNTGVALWQITERYEWFDRPLWAIVVLALGLVVFAAGFGLDLHERTRRRVGSN